MASTAKRSTHAAAYTETGRDTGRSICGEPDGPVTTNWDRVECPRCHRVEDKAEQQVYEYTGVSVAGDKFTGMFELTSRRVDAPFGPALRVVKNEDPESIYPGAQKISRVELALPDTHGFSFPIVFGVTTAHAARAMQALWASVAEQLEPTYSKAEIDAETDAPITSEPPF